MARDLGTKHSCFKCSTKFYDLKKPAPVGPKCGADQRDAPVVKPMSAAARRAAAAERKIEEEAEGVPAETDADAEADDEAEEEPEKVEEEA